MSRQPSRWIALYVSFLIAFLTSSFPAWASSLSRKPTPPRPNPHTKAILPATANALATAMDIPAASLVSATLTTSDPLGVGIGNSALGRHFPIQGSTFAILTTGEATSAEQPNDDDSTSTTLSGLDNSQGEDMVQL